MRKLSIVLGLAALACGLASAGAVQVRPLGQPFYVPPVGTETTESATTDTIERAWGQAPPITVDAVTGQITVGDDPSRAIASIYDDTVTSLNSGPSTCAIGTAMGDTLRMRNSGVLQSMKFSMFNVDSGTDTLLSCTVTVQFRGMNRAIFASYTTNLDLTTLPDGGLLDGYIVTVTLSNLASQNIVLPEGVVHVGLLFSNVVGSPGDVDNISQGLYDPPVIGASRDRFWRVDGAGTWGNYWFSGSPRANFYYQIEVDEAHTAANPVYSNITNSTGYGSSKAAGVTMMDDLSMLRGGTLDRIEFSVWNASTADTLQTVDMTILFRDWSPTSCTYVPNPYTLSFDNVAVNLAPSYAGFFYVANLGSQGITLADDILAGLTFSDYQPATITGVGQLLYNPPTVGGSEDYYYRLPDEAWYWYSGNPLADFYWRIDLVSPLPCTQQGDMNCDGSVNSQDIDGFIYALFSKATEYDAYLHSFPVYHPCDMICADFTGDGAVNSQDIDGFIAALFGH